MPERECDYAGRADEPCWGRCGWMDADYARDGTPIALWACEGHAGMWARGGYRPEHPEEKSDDE